MLCSMICYTLPDVSENRKSYISELPISLSLEHFVPEDRGITPPRNLGNSLSVDVLKKIPDDWIFYFLQLCLFTLWFFSFSSFFLLH
jgi:hypothetical protein